MIEGYSNSSKFYLMLKLLQIGNFSFCSKITVVVGFFFIRTGEILSLLIILISTIKCRGMKILFVFARRHLYIYFSFPGCCKLS